MTLTTNLGGPVLRDRLWFFAGYQYLRDYDSQPGTDPAFPRTYEQDKIFAKLTWRLAPGMQLLQSFHDEFWVNPELPTLVKPFEATQRRHASVPAMTFGHLTHTLSSNTVWDVRVGRFVFDRKDDPSTGSVTTPSRFDRATGVFSGAPQTFGGLTLIRTTAKGTINHYRPELLGADHQWRIGGQFEKGEHHLSMIIPTGVRFVDNTGQPFQAVSSAPSMTGGVFFTASGFVSDAITMGTLLTINAGLRFDHSRAISQDLRALDAQGRETDTIVRGLGTLYTWNVWSPRLGVTVKLTADGRTMLRASYGRFNQGVLTGELSPIHPGATPTTTAAFNSATGDYTTIVSVVDPKRNLQLDPETRSPRTDEYSIGVDREVGRRLAVAIAYVRKAGSHFIGWTDVGGQYREETRSLPDGRSLPVFVITNSTADRRFLLTNPDGYSLTYNGLVMAVEKRRSRWVAGVRILHLVESLRAAAVQRSDCRGIAGQHDRRHAVPHIRAGSEQPHQRARPAAKRSTAHAADHGQRRRAPDRIRPRGQRAALQRQAVGGDRADHAAAGRPAHPPRAARLPPAVVANTARFPPVEADLVGRLDARRASRGRAQCAQ